MPGLSYDRRDPIWLLDFDVGGRVYRFATTPVRITDARGRVWVYAGGLGEDLELGRVRELGIRNVPIDIYSEVDWAEHVARGIMLEDRRATLRLHFEGDVLELAETYADGLTESVRYREQGEPLSFEIVQDNQRDSLTLPQSSHKSGSETWPSSGRGGFVLDDSQTGIFYPVVVGYPGDHPKVGATDIAEPAFIVPMVESKDSGPPGSVDYLVVGLGRTDVLDQSGKVGLYNYGEANWAYAEETVDDLVVDLLGQSVSMVQGTAAQITEDTVSGATLTGPYYCGYRNATGFGGGVISPYSGNVLRNAGEVLRFLIDYFAPLVELDTSRLGAADAWLNRFKFDFALTEPSDISQVVENDLLPLLPVMGVDGRDGYYFAPLKWDATRVDAVAWLDADKGDVAIEDLEMWEEPVYNKLTLEYRMNAQKGHPMSYQTLTSVNGKTQLAQTIGVAMPPNAAGIPWAPMTEIDVNTSGSALCTWSQARHGLRELVTTSSYIWNDATAALILQYQALRYAYRKRLCRAIGGTELRSLEPGNVIVLNHDSMHLTDVVCIVADSIVSVDSVALDLVLLEHPLNRPRKTS